jgi:hypothetical protein
VPEVVLRVRAAKPTLTFFAEYRCRHITRLIQMGNRFARRIRLAGRAFPGLLCSHGQSLAGILLRTRCSGQAVLNICGDFRVAAFLREIERGLAVIRLRLEIGAVFHEVLKNFETAVGRGGERR